MSNQAGRLERADYVLRAGHFQSARVSDPRHRRARADANPPEFDGRWVLSLAPVFPRKSCRAFLVEAIESLKLNEIGQTNAL